MIIIEGCDGTGKTTLAKELSKLSSLNYAKQAVPKTGLKHYVDTLQKDHSKTIFDRFHFGEHVYPIVKKDGRRPLREHEIYMLDLAIAAQGGILVYCHASKKFIEKVFEERGEDFITKKDVPTVLKEYDTCLKWSVLPKIMYNVEKDDPKQKAKQILELHEACSQFIVQSKSGMGFNNANIMLVGDRTNPLIKNRRQAFFHEIGCSPFLMKGLVETGLRYYLVNSYNTGDKKTDLKLLSDEIDMVKPKKIIALGNYADKMLKKLDKPHDKTFHPQYWRRFHSGDFKEFVNDLK